MLTVLIGVLYLFRFIFGACVFSFLTVVIYRLPKGENFVYGRSHCPDCGRMLSAGELIPCVSYLVQRGRCLGCGMRISGQYILVECLGGIAFVFCSACFGSGETGFLSLRGWIGFIYMGILTVVAFIDWNTKIIYDRFHIFIVLLGIAAIWVFPEHGIKEKLFGAVIVSVPMLVLALLIEGAFGGGDIKRMAARFSGNDSGNIYRDIVRRKLLYLDACKGENVTEGPLRLWAVSCNRACHIMPFWRADTHVVSVSLADIVTNQLSECYGEKGEFSCRNFVILRRIWRGRTCGGQWRPQERASYSSS